jgi:hypothetical protein
MSQQEVGETIHSPSESTPLLRDNSFAENGVVSSVNAAASGETEGSEIPLLQEPTVKELLLTMSSVWVGVFFAALGMTSDEILLYPASEICSDSGA